MATLHIEGSETEIKTILEALRGPDHLGAMRDAQERMGREVVNKLLVPVGALAMGAWAGKKIGPDLAFQFLPHLFNLAMGGENSDAAQAMQDLLKSARNAVQEGVPPVPDHPKGEAPCECPACNPSPRSGIAEFLAEAIGGPDLLKQLQALANCKKPLEVYELRPGLMSRFARAIKSYPSIQGALLDQAEWLASPMYATLVLDAASYLYSQLVECLIGLPPVTARVPDDFVKRADPPGPNPEAVEYPPPRVIPLRSAERVFPSEDAIRYGQELSQRLASQDPFTRPLAGVGMKLDGSTDSDDVEPAPDSE